MSEEISERLRSLPSDDLDRDFPLHQLGLARMGLTFLEWLRLDALLATAERFGRNEFLVTAAPLPVAAGTGSPLNPIARSRRGCERGLQHVRSGEVSPRHAVRARGRQLDASADTAEAAISIC